MMRIKLWLINKILPVWAKEGLLRDNERLTKENQKLKAENDQLNAYIAGLEAGIKAQRRVVINTNVNEVRRSERKCDEQNSE